MAGAREQRRVLARAAALAAELVACVGELPTPEDNSPPAATATEARALSTKEAAARLGVTPYTVNDWCRRGLLGCRQDTPGGRRHFRERDLAEYEAAHERTVFALGIPDAYSSGHESQSTPRPAAQARVDASQPRNRPRRKPQHDCPVGTRRAPHRATRRERPYAPGAHLWTEPPKEPEG